MRERRLAGDLDLRLIGDLECRLAGDLERRRGGERERLLIGDLEYRRAGELERLFAGDRERLLGDLLRLGDLLVDLLLKKKKPFSVEKCLILPKHHLVCLNTYHMEDCKFK